MNGFIVLSALFAVAAAAPHHAYVHAPLGYAAAPYAAPFAYAAPVVPAVQTVHYADTPVVTGYSSTIYKPTLNAAPAFAFKSGEHAVLPYAAPYAVAYTSDLSAPIPAGDAPAPEELVQKQKVYAPVRASQKITPTFDVHLAPEVQVKKVAVEVPVAAPYAAPYAVPVPVHHVAHAAPFVVVKKH